MKNRNHHPLLYLALLSFFMFLSGLNMVYAQGKIKGKVVDDKKIGIPYSSVALWNADGNMLIKGSITNLEGLFAVETKAGEYTLIISNMGFLKVTRKIVLSSDKDLEVGEITLNSDIQNLQEVKIVGSKPFVLQKTDRIILNVGESVLAAGNDAYSIIGMAPSVQMTNGNISMEGKSNVLIILDGKKIPNATLSNILSAIPGDQIDRIELITNPSSKYDASASGGVIEIYTKRSKKLGWTANTGGNLTQGYRFGGGANAGLRIGAPKLDFTLNGSYTKRGHIEKGYDNRVLFQGRNRVGDFNQTVDISDGAAADGSINASLNYYINKKNTIGADYTFVKVHMYGKGNVDALITQPNNFSKVNTFNNLDLKVDFANYDVFYKLDLDTLGSNLLLTTNYTNYISNQNQQFNQDKFNNGAVSPEVSLFRNKASSNYDIYTASLDYTQQLNPKLKLESGLKYTYTHNNSLQHPANFVNNQWQETGGNFSSLGYKEQIPAAYLNFNYETGKFNVQAGLRGEFTQYAVVMGLDSNYFNLFPNVRADYKVTKNYTTSLAYAKSINRPSYDDLIPYELYIDNYTLTRGNALLRPEYQHSFTWSNLYKKYSFRFGYTQTEDAIMSTILYDQNSLRFIKTKANFLKNHLVSASLGFPIKFADWWNSNNRLSGYYQNIRFPDPLENTSIMIRKKYYFTVFSNHTFKISSTVSGELSASYESPVISGIYDYNEYVNVTAGIRKKIFKNLGFIKLDVSDIFYKNNQLLSTNIVPLITESIHRVDTRRVRIAFGYNFGKIDKDRRVQTNGNGDELGRLKL
ncbi:outer membrane beta-barrel protein [Pedobacter petrophilus]|uniref:Outer membrane beta-barrel protein n=1 Tax=Pedobacter petrophilus TaxID=1908241 RepID=A0A7K0G2N7_9SPHI|nr:TonB-dependent receptor [Pedobacter petrophilus]MRX77872.1 outer membrane beta-barrel protein [Pedobacter petrophilus]